MAQDLLVLPERFFVALLDDKTNTSIKAIANEFCNNFNRYSSKGLGPAFFGAPGAGKTHAAAAVARIVNTRGVQTYWASTVEELNLVLDLKDYRVKSYFTKKDILKNTEFVVFDDFGQLTDFPRIRELFFEIVDHRYSWKLPTLFTANFTISQDIDWEREIGQCFNTSLARRIKDMSQGLAFST